MTNDVICESTMIIPMPSKKNEKKKHPRGGTTERFHIFFSIVSLAPSSGQSPIFLQLDNRSYCLLQN